MNFFMQLFFGGFGYVVGGFGYAQPPIVQIVSVASVRWLSEVVSVVSATLSVVSATLSVVSATLNHL
jgi:hypothetical protein